MDVKHGGERPKNQTGSRYPTDEQLAVIQALFAQAQRVRDEIPPEDEIVYSDPRFNQ